jgi:transposase
LPEHLPRRRIVYPVATSCACCGGGLRKLGEDVTETLERIPASWYVLQHVREKMSCRRCEAISQPPAPFHPIARGRAGPNLLAEVVFGKFGLHLPLHRQSERFGCEGVPIDVSTLADWVGAITAALQPLTEAIRTYLRTAERLHVDDTPVPVLARGKTRTGRLWTVVRDDRPFGGPDPPAAAYFYSPDRRGEHAESFLGGFTGILQADAFSGFGRLYELGRKPGTHAGSRLLVARPEEFLRAGRSQESAAGDRGGATDRRDLCHRAGDQRSRSQGACRRAFRPFAPPRCGARDLAA